MTSTKTRRLRVGAVIVGLAAGLGGLWVLSDRSVSPDQRLADTKPPLAAVVDLELERRVLADTILVRGQIAIREELVVVAPGGAVAGDGAGAGVAIVGELPYGVGDEVPAGGVVAVVSDRPVIVVPMSLPMYRPLTPGDEGRDVERLQGALVLLGYEVETDGRFGRGTQAAVEAFYEDRGFTAQRTGPELDAELEAAESAADEALRAVQGAERAWDSAAASGDRSQLDTAEASIHDARRVLAASREARDEARAKVGTIVPLGELVGLANFPVVVSRLPAEVGSLAEGPVAVLSPSDLVVRAPSDATRSMVLQPGLEGTASIDGHDAEIPVVVADTTSGSDTESTGETSGAGSSGASIMFSPVDQIPAELLGRQVVVEVVLAASDDAVLAAPTSVVRADGDGQYLLVVDDDGETRRVGFRPGLSIGGWVEVIDPEIPVDEGQVVRAG